jgi:co-chaperonin GroES (HSP10)
MNKPTVQLLNDYILVEFEEKPKLSEKLDLVMPDRYLIQEADQEGETNAYGVVTDRRTINPQIIKVIQGNESIPRGSRCFVHYGAFEIAKWYNGQAIIRASMVFFMLDPIRPFEGNYLAEEIVVEGEKTESGIYLTPTVETKLPCNVRILYIPEISILNVGDEVITIDAANYTLKFEDKTYIKLKESEIIGKVVNGETIPLGKNILIEYMDEDLSEIIADNDRKDFSKDFALKHRLFIPDIDLTQSPPPKTVPAKILAIGPEVNRLAFSGDIGDEATALRGRGVLLPNNKWIVNLDTILFLHGESNRKAV